MSQTRALPFLPAPAELNRLLLILDHFRATRTVALNTAVRAMASMNFGGRLPDHRMTVAGAAASGLVSDTRGRLRITPLGEEFIGLNPEKTYELTAAQKTFLVERCLLREPYAEVTGEILASFRHDVGRKTLFCDLQTSSLDGPLHQSAVSFLCGTGLLVNEGGLVWVAPVYLAQVSRFRSRVPVSAEELEEALRRQREQGLAAEQWVLEYERRRLRERSCHAEADTVQQVSHIDICAGYDIASFDGQSEDFNFDRLIEVKSTSRPEPAFVWSQNEIQTARRLRERYWLYLLTGFQPTGKTPSLTTLRNPASLLGRTGRISLTPIQYRAELR